MKKLVKALKKVTADLEGKRVRRLRPLTRDEMQEQGWQGGDVTAIEFSDGTLVFASRDHEGNAPGALFGIVDGEPVSW